MRLDRSSTKRINSQYLVGTIILFVGALLRFAGLNWGITSIFQPDEGKHIFPMVEMANSGRLIHSLWIYPSQVTSKVVAFVMCFLMRITAIRYIDYYFIYRGVVCLQSVLIIVISFLIVKELFDMKLALLFSFLIAIFPPYIKYSKQITGDTSVLFFELCLLLFSIYYLKNHSIKCLFLMGFFSACATMEKWHGACICLYIVVCVGLQTLKKRHLLDKIKVFMIDGLLVLVAWIGSCLFWAPNLLIEYRAVYHDMFYAYNYDGRLLQTSIMDYFRFMFSYAGFLTVIVVVIGVIQFIHYDCKKMYICIPGVINLLSLRLIMPRSAERWGLGIYYTILLFLAYGIIFVFKYINLKKIKILNIAGAFICTVIICTMLCEAINVDLYAILSKQDVRLKGELLLKDLHATTENTASDYYTTFWPGGMRLDGESSSNRINEIIVLKDDRCYRTIDNIEFVVIGGYDWLEKDEGLYHAIENQAIKVGEISSKHGDLFEGCNGNGRMEQNEFKTILYSISDSIGLLNGESIGPGMRVYNVHDFPLLEEM